MDRQPYLFTLPASFDPSEFLSPRLLTRADDARWFVSTVVAKTANRDTDSWGCVRLHSAILRRIMDSRTAPDVIRALKRGQAIESYAYCAGVKAKGYRLGKRYLGDRCVRWPAVDPRLMERLDQERQRLDAEETTARWQPIHYALAAEQRGLTIDAAADAILGTLPEHTRLCQDVLVSRLRERDYHFSVSTTGRVFNAITGLKRELRRALRIGGETLGGVDIACAQPALLALDMAQNIPPSVPEPRTTYKHALPGGPAPPAPYLPAPDSASFASLVVCGGLYEVLMKKTGLDRDSVKLAFLRDVLAKRGRYPSAVEQSFRLAFPGVYSYVKAVNRHDHGELIRRLQRLESWLVVESVAPRLIGRVPCLTLHDAIYSTRRAVPTVVQAFDEIFDAIGFRLTLKQEVA